MSDEILRLDEIGTPDAASAILVISGAREIDSFANYQISNATVRFVRGQRCLDEARLFQEWAAAFQFPYYFGHNWDAFHECIRDLDWMPADAYVAVVTNVDKMLPEDPDSFRILVELLEDSAQYWRNPTPNPPFDRPAIFQVIYHAERDAAESARRRLTEAGASFEVRILLDLGGGPPRIRV
jgi:hypothetical protein